jgi:uncharacterized protein
MSTIPEQIEAIEKEIRETPYHKATEHHIGKLRAKLSKLRAKEEEQKTRKSGGGGGYAVKKQGDATVVLVGPPSVGKSTLLNKLTNAKSKIAPYAFTTVTVIPGMMAYQDARIQILDVPGLIEGAEEGKGRGREVLSVVRASELLIIMTDPDKLSALKTIPVALERNGIRINKTPPDVIIEKKLKGGVIVHSNITQDLGIQTIKDVASEFGFKNAEITIREKLTMDRLIDAFARNRVYVRSISVINKSDLLDRNLTISGETPTINISAEKNENINKLRKTIWEKLNFLRIYLVRQDEVPNTDNPLIVSKGSTLAGIAQKLGEDFSKDKKRAKIWGIGSKFPGQEVSLSTHVQEGMMVRFI